MLSIVCFSFEPGRENPSGHRQSQESARLRAIGKDSEFAEIGGYQTASWSDGGVAMMLIGKVARTDLEGLFATSPIALAFPPSSTCSTNQERGHWAGWASRLDHSNVETACLCRFATASRSGRLSFRRSPCRTSLKQSETPPFRLCQIAQLQHFFFHPCPHFSVAHSCSFSASLTLAASSPAPEGRRGNPNHRAKVPRRHLRRRARQALLRRPTFQNRRPLAHVLEVPRQLWANPSRSLEWTLPPGWEAGPLEFPLPLDAVSKDGSTPFFAYEHEVAFPVKITPARKLREATSRSRLKSSGRSARSDCVPGDDVLKLELPVGPAKPANEEFFKLWLSQLPQTSEPPTKDITCNSWSRISSCASEACPKKLLCEFFPIPKRTYKGILAFGKTRIPMKPRPMVRGP